MAENKKDKNNKTSLFGNAKVKFSELKKRHSEKKSKSNSEPGEVKGFLRSLPIILIAVALFITLCFITQETGAFGSFISKFLRGLFSYVAYAIPLFIATHAVLFYNDVKEHKVAKRVIFSLIALITLSATAYIIRNIGNELTYDAALFYNDGINCLGGGLIGSTFAFLLTKIIGKVGLIIAIIVIILLYAISFFSGGHTAISNFFLKLLSKFANFGAELEEKSKTRKKKAIEGKLAKQRASDDKKNADFYNDEFFGTDNGVSRLEIPELGILETKQGLGKAHILRETVIQNTEDDVLDEIVIEQEEPPKKENKIFNAHIEFAPSDEPTAFVRSETNTENYRKDDIVYEPVNNATEEIISATEPVVEENKTAIDFGIDDSADAVFTANFDPYDIALNERRARKSSTKTEEERPSARAFSEYIHKVSVDKDILTKKVDEEAARQAEIARKAAEEQAARAAREAIERENARIAEERKAEEALREEARRAMAAKLNAEAENNKTYESEIKKEQPSLTQSRPIPTITKVGVEYEMQYGSSMKKPQTSDNPKNYSAPVNNYSDTTITASSKNQATDDSVRYRFVKETLSEVRRPYTSDSEVSEPELSKKIDSESINIPLSNPSLPRTETIVALPVIEEVRETDSQKVENEPSVSDETSTENYFEDSSKEIIENEYVTPSESLTFEEDDKLEVERTIIEPSIDFPRGLDFSFDTDSKDDFEEEELDEAEEMIEADYSEENFVPTEIPPEQRNPDIEKYRNMFDIFNDDTENYSSNTLAPEDISENIADEDEEISDEAYVEEVFEDNEDTIYPNDISDADDNEDEDDDTPPFESSVNTKKEAPKPKKADYSNYKLPPIDLLKKVVVENADLLEAEVQRGGEQLISTLESFNIRATVRGIEPGPRITRYSIVPAKGVRVNQIEKLADDIALAMAAESIRIEAPIPGKSAVGVEVPNKYPSIVSLRELLESDDFINNKSKTAVCIGKSVEGINVFGDIGKMPHLLVAGATGMGKSVCINSLITSILYKARPDEVKFIMIDPKKVEFAPYNGIPHLLVPVVTDPKQAAGALLWAVDEMNKRYDIIEKLCVRSIDSYNEKVAEKPELGAPMPKIVIFIDELNDLMIQVRDPVENLITLIAQKARAAGIHLVIGTQRPSVNVITGVIKANIPSRIACKVASSIDSRTILEQTGAEKLIGKGDMLFAPGGAPNPKRVQGAFVSESETTAIVDFVKAQTNGELYDEQAMEDMRRAAQKCDKNKDDMDDDDDEDSGVGCLNDRKFLNAVELAIRNGSVATSFLQRKLHIGYGKAAQYIDSMEDLGIVGEKNGSKARDVLISMEEWNEKLARLSDY